MANGDKEFLIRVRADIQQALGELKRLPNELNQIGQASKGQAQATREAGAGMAFLRNAALAFISLDTARRVIQTADAFGALDTRIRTATRATGDYEEVSRELLAISNRNGVALEKTVSLFQNLARAAPELGATNKEVLKVVEVIEQLAIISGAGGANLSAGLTQLSQGLAGGTLRAEELNSLLENIPEVANRIAKGMGLTVGQFRQMVIEGKIFGREVFGSLLKQAPEVAAEVGEIPARFEQGLTSLQNSVGNFLRVMDTSVDGTSYLGRALKATAERIDELAIKFGGSNAEKLNLELKELTRSFDRLQKSGLSPTSDVMVFLGKRIEETKRRLAELQQQTQVTVGPKAPQISPEQLAADNELTKQIERYRELAAAIDGTDEAKARYLVTTARAVKGDETLKTTLIDLARARDRDRAAIERQRELKANRSADVQHLRDLEEEIRLLGLSERARAQAEAAGRLSKDSPEADRRRAAELAGDAFDTRRAREIFEKTRTPAENLNTEFADLADALEKGKINWDTYERAVFDAQERFEEMTKEVGKNADEMTEFGKQAARGIQQTFADEFFNVMQGNFDNLGESFTRLLQRMTAELAASQLLEFLVGDYAKTGKLGGWLGQITAGWFHSGGVVGASGGASRNVSPLAFLGAPRLHAGNLGIKRDEYPAILQEGEGVLSRAQMRALGGSGAGGGELRVIVENRGTPQVAREATGALDPEGMVVRIVTDDVQRGGPLSQSLARTFNLRRSGG